MRYQLSLIGVFVMLFSFNTHAGETSAGQLAQAGNEFGLNLYREVAQEKGNVFIAPYSVSSALAMTWAGAKNETALEMGSVLNFDLDSFDPNSSFKLLNNELQEIEAVTMNIANSLWPAMELKLNREYQQSMEKYYQVSVTPLDFRTDTENSRITINKWVEDKTREKIKNLISPGAIDPMTALVLVNAVYFKGDWANQFDKKRTVDKEFTTASGVKQKAQFMRQKHQFKYRELEGLQILEMPYTGDRIAMTIFLPQDTKSLSSIEKALTAEKLNDWLKYMRQVEVDVSIPKFVMEWGTTDITGSLQKLGIKNAFSGKADFTGMVHGGGVKIDMVLHKTFIEVNEEGSEAAGATAVIMRKTAMIRTPEFRADRPFIFMIRDTSSGAILFLGRVSEL